MTVSFNLAPNASLGAAINAINKVAKDMNFPPSVQAGFQGTAAAFQNSLSNEAAADSGRAGHGVHRSRRAVRELHSSHHHSFHLPSAGVGALLSLILFDQDLSVVAIIGIILLIGIVKKNGIMMVDFALEGERQQG